MSIIGLQWGYYCTGPGQRVAMSPDTAELLPFLHALPLFRGLSDQEIQILLIEARHRVFQSEQLLFAQGEPGNTCHIILRGRVRVFVSGEDGRELSVRILGPGEIVGEMALFENLPRSANVVSLDETHTLELDQEGLLRCLRRCPALALGLLQALSARLRLTTEEAEGLASLPVAERLLRRLQQLAEGSGVRVSDGVRITLPMTQQELATLVGTSRESVNRALVKLRQQGLIRLDGGWIILLDTT